jgi:hypothetical protein
MALDYLADTCMMLGEISPVGPYLREAEAIWRQVRDPYNLVNNLTIQGQFLMITKAYDACEHVLTEVRDLGQVQEDWEGVLLAELGFWELAVHRGALEQLESIHQRMEALLSRVPAYLIVRVDCYRAAHLYKQERAREALEVLLDCRVRLGDEHWRPHHQRYLDLYQETVATGSYRPLPLEVNPLHRPD